MSYSAARGGDGACSQSGECRFEEHAARGSPPQHGQVEGGALSSAEFNETPPEGTIRNTIHYYLLLYLKYYVLVLSGTSTLLTVGC